MASKDLIHRLNRISGQIAAIKRNIETGTGSCADNIVLTKAVIQALKKFAQAYVEQHVSECSRMGSSAKDIEEELKKVVASAFSL